MLNDAQKAYQRLEQDAGRLFASDATRVVVWPEKELGIPVFAEKKIFLGATKQNRVE